MILVRALGLDGCSFSCCWWWGREDEDEEEKEEKEEKEDDKFIHMNLIWFDELIQFNQL